MIPVFLIQCQGWGSLQEREGRGEPGIRAGRTEREEGLVMNRFSSGDFSQTPQVGR